jgi:hypothetical protein
MVIELERLEDRLMLSAGPITSLHFASLGNFDNGSYMAPGNPGSAGFNLADVHTPEEVNALPNGVKGLVWVGMTNGADSDFINFIRPFIGNPKVYGFYLADEPNPAVVPAANLKAESDWIHANFPGTKTFIVLYNNYQGYTPSNTDIDLVGLDPYPIRTWGVDYSYIPQAVSATLSLGWSLDQIVPVYQAFGGAGSYVVPTVEQEQTILDIWGGLVPHPAFDYAYSWGEEGYQGLVEFPDLQAVFMAHNSNSNQQPATLAALLGYGVQRLQVDLFTSLATVQASFMLEAQQAHAAQQANPWHGTALGSMVEARVDQLFASWQASL